MHFLLVSFIVILFLPFSLLEQIYPSEDQSTETPPAPPVFSHKAGQYTAPFELQLSSTENVTILYSTDGSIPTDSTGFVYTDPILIEGVAVIRARSYTRAGLSSETVTNVYSTLEENTADFNSNLPLVVIHQFDVPITPHDRSLAYITFIDVNQAGRASLKDNIALQSRMMTNVRGSSSQQFPKKQFAVRLIDDYDQNRNEPVLGMPSENNWILHAPYDDKTLMRNAVAYQLSRDMGWYAPRTRFVELFLHEGDGPLTMEHYHGLYMIVERIKWDNNRVNIEKLTPEDNTEPAVTGGYIFQNDRDVHITTSRGSSFALVRPQDWDITDTQREWITNYLDQFESALFSADFADPDEGYRGFINVESFIDHHLITELAKEIDGYRLSTFIHKDRNGKLTMGPLWDFNLSFGNANYNRGWDPIGWYYSIISQRQYLYGWYTRLFQDPQFSQMYRHRWWELRKTVFSNDHISGLIHHFAELLDEAQERNFVRWPILGTYVWPNWFIGQTYEEEVNFMLEWVENRLEWIDSQMGDPPLSTLLHFWHFTTDLPNDTPLETVAATYSIIDGAVIEFQSCLQGYPFYPNHPLWRKASMERRNQPTPLNYRPDGNNGKLYDGREMRGLQIRQPFKANNGTNTMIFHVPTTGYEGIVFSFAAMNEAAADELVIDFQTATDVNAWTSWGALSLHDHFELFTVDFTDIAEVNDNPHFRIRIRFDGNDLSADDGNRVTFNNVSLTSTVLPVNVSQFSPDVPTEFRLEQNFPNPFNPSTTIRFSIPEQVFVQLKVYNILGQHVKTLAEEEFEAGTHEVELDGSHLASGVYIYKIKAGNYHDSRTLMLVK